MKTRSGAVVSKYFTTSSTGTVCNNSKNNELLSLENNVLKKENNAKKNHNIPYTDTTTGIKKIGKNKMKVNINKNWSPSNWKIQFQNIREMRKNLDAPVDTMGCERCTSDNYSEKQQRFHILVSLMLSSQTKDNVTHAAMTRLLDNGLTVESVIKMPDGVLGKLIYPVGFWKKKVEYIKKVALILKEQYDSDIPDTVKELTKLPGVGNKMAYLTMNCAWHKVVGIGVDLHVHRIANRLQWVRKETKTPEKTRRELEEWLPQSYWKEANWLLVGFGQQICTAQPKCSQCLNKNICPSAFQFEKKK